MNSRLVSTTQRLLYLAALSAFLTLGGFVFVENRELQKVVPATGSLKASILLGYLLALIMVNYMMAIRGDNWTDPAGEALVVLGCWLTVVTFVGPSMFPVVVPGEPLPAWHFWGGDNGVLTPDRRWYWLLVAAVSLLVFALVRIGRFLYVSSKLSAASETQVSGKPIP